MTVLTNRISLSMTDADVRATRDALKVLQTSLLPYLVDLDAALRRELPKMGPRTLSFVGRSLDYARGENAFRPPFVDMAEFQRDWGAVEQLGEFENPLRKLTDMVTDTMMLAGSEAYSAALACYQTIKAAARMQVEGAEMAAQDLEDRYPGRGTRPRPPATGA